MSVGGESPREAGADSGRGTCDEGESGGAMAPTVARLPDSRTRGGGPDVG